MSDRVLSFLVLSVPCFIPTRDFLLPPLLPKSRFLFCTCFFLLTQFSVRIFLCGRNRSGQLSKGLRYTMARGDRSEAAPSFRSTLPASSAAAKMPIIHI
uniref:Secreted protein n=1 Tax=Meloidogyne incognita TaxID=6306 RepID=A0A914MRS5_MELIC